MREWKKKWHLRENYPITVASNESGEQHVDGTSYCENDEKSREDV